MTRVYVSVGSNIDREKNIHSSLSIIKKKYPSMQQSPIYESEAVGFTGDPFYNLVISFETVETARQITDYLHGLEQQHGRRRSMPRFTARTLDLDLLTFGTQIIDLQGLQLPRQEILQYAFVLLPLADLAPNECHPSLHKTYRQLWQAFDAPGQSLKPVATDEMQQGISE